MKELNSSWRKADILKQLPCKEVDYVDRFTSMFGMVGLADAVNHLLGAKDKRTDLILKE